MAEGKRSKATGPKITGGSVRKGRLALSIKDRLGTLHTGLKALGKSFPFLDFLFNSLKRKN